MHVDHELVEFVPVDEPDYEEVIQEYEEEILVQEGAPEPVGADLTWWGHGTFGYEQWL